MTRRAFSFAAACASTACARGRNTFEKCSRPYEESGKFMGSVLVAKGSRVIFQRSSGYAHSSGTCRMWRPESFASAMSTQFTAAGILLLVADGRLDLDTSVTNDITNAPAAWKPVTLHNLLTHTAGIPNLTSLPDFQKTKTLHSTLSEAMLRFRDLPLEFVPGTDGRYSNSGYIVLANVIESVSKQTFVDFLTTRVLSPLGLKETGADSS